VHGDTLTAFIGAYISVLLQIPVAHLEAGLRSFDTRNPFPEEFHRKAIGQLANIHFAPTILAAANLVREGVSESNISIVGNSVVDAMDILAQQLDGSETKDGKTVLVTMHRRENWGDPISFVAERLREFAKENVEFRIRWVLHSNPLLSESVSEKLSGVQNIELLQPLSYPEMLTEIKKTDIILTDSGGVQEEAPSFKKPVIVLRKQSERLEGIHLGLARLVDPLSFNAGEIVEFLNSNPFGDNSSFSLTNPYGDGLCSVRCVSAIESFLTHGEDNWKFYDPYADGFNQS
jgi:UDP-N-acetylglucosamine 2-epimerase (non-hydrolysing)